MPVVWSSGAIGLGFSFHDCIGLFGWDCWALQLSPSGRGRFERLSRPLSSTDTFSSAASSAIPATALTQGFSTLASQFQDQSVQVLSG